MCIRDSCERIGRGRELARRLVGGERWDLVFNICEGVWGRSREAQVPALCELFDQPYTFADPLTCALTLDKAMAKRVVADHAFRHRLVEGERAGERIGEGVRLVEQLAQRGHLRLARAPPDALADVEHEVPALAADQAAGEFAPAPDPLAAVPETGERLLEAGDGVKAVELEHVLRREPRREIVVLQVVGQADRETHASTRAPPGRRTSTCGPPSCAAAPGRSRPTRSSPPGSAPCRRHPGRRSRRSAPRSRWCGRAAPRSARSPWPRWCAGGRSRRPGRTGRGSTGARGP